MNLSSNNTLLLFFLVFSLSCERTTEKLNFEGNQINEPKPSFELKKTGEYIIPIDSVTPNIITSYNHIFKGDEEYFIWMNTYTNSLYYYNLRTEQLESIERYPQNGPNSIGKFTNVTEFKILGDSIAFYDRSYKRLYIVNKEKEVVHQHDFGVKHPNAPYGIYGDWLVKEGNNFNFSVSPIPLLFKKVTNDNKLDSLELLYNIQTEVEKKSYMPMPNAYLGHSWLTEHLYHYRNYSDSSKTYTYSWPGEKNIYYRDSLGKISSSYLGSNNVNPIQAIDGHENVLSDMQSKAKFYFQQGRYGKISYDPFRKIYIRYAFSGIPIERIDVNNPMADTSAYDRVFIIGDSDFNKVGELSNSSLNATVIFFRENGIYILRNSDNEDQLIFDIYNLEKLQ